MSLRICFPPKVTLALLLFACVRFSGGSDLTELRIRAYIDGRSQLVVRPDSIRWEHLEYAKPGRHGENNYPTYVNGYAWHPSYPDGSTTSPGQSFPLVIGTALANEVALEPIEVRGVAQIVQQPAAMNGSVLIVEFNDAADGPAWYEILLQNIEPISLDSGLAAYYPFSGNAKDETGNGNDGVVHGATLTRDRFGKPASAYSFNGSSSYIEMLRPLSDGDSMSFSVWITAPVAGFNQAVFFEGDATPGFDFALSFNSIAFNDGPRLIFPTKDNTTLSYAFGARNTESWVHIVGVADALQGRKELWINGRLVSAGTFEGSANIARHYKLQVGRGFDGTQTSAHFLGKIDDLRFYNRALTEAEIKALRMDLQLKKAAAPGANLVFNTVLETNYTLQSSIDLNTWRDIDSVVGNGQQNSISIAGALEHEFFRLIQR